MGGEASSRLETGDMGVSTERAAGVGPTWFILFNPAKVAVLEPSEKIALDRALALAKPDVAEPTLLNGLKVRVAAVAAVVVVLALNVSGRDE